MRMPMRLLAALIAGSLAVEPAVCQVRTIRVKPGAFGSGAAGTAVTGKTPAPLNLSLPLLNGKSLPSVESIAFSAQPLALPAPLAKPAEARIAVEAHNTPKTVFQKKLNAIGKAVENAGRGTETKSAEGGKAAADKQFSALGTGAGEEDFAALFEESLAAWGNGKLKSAGSGSTAKELLADETPHFTGNQLKAIQNASRALEGAVTKAVAQLLPEAGIRAVSRGSSARLTQDDAKVDYDIMAALPASWSLGRAEGSDRYGL